MNLKLTITVINVMADDEIRAEGKLDLASGGRDVEFSVRVERMSGRYSVTQKCQQARRLLRAIWSPDA